MASQSIDQKSDSRALPTLARTGLCLFGDELRRVGAFGTSAVLLLGMACGVAVIHAWACLCGSFRGCSHRANEYKDCKIVVRIDQSLTWTAVS